MKIENKRLFETAGVISVVLSLLFVAYQIQQANRIALAEAEADLRSSVRELNLTIAESSELSRIAVKARDNPSDLTPVEEYQLRYMASSHFSILTQANQAFENGLLSTYSLNIHRIMIKDTLDANPAFADAYADIAKRYGFEEGTSALWDELLEELRLRGYDF